jgi:hypothetical protein
MATNPNRGGASAPLDTAWSTEVRGRAARLVDDFADRIGQGEQELAAPGCNRRCSPCFRECAVRAVIATWWAGKLAEVMVEEGELLSHNGRIYAEPQGRA